MSLHLPPGPHPATIGNQVVERGGRVDITQILSVVGDLHRRHQPHRAAGRRPQAEDGPQEGRLAGPVRPDETDHITTAEGAAPRREELTLTDRHPQLLGDQELIATARRGLERDGHHPLGAGRGGEPLDPGQPATTPFAWAEFPPAMLRRM